MNLQRGAQSLTGIFFQEVNFLYLIFLMNCTKLIFFMAVRSKIKQAHVKT